MNELFYWRKCSASTLSADTMWCNTLERKKSDTIRNDRKSIKPARASFVPNDKLYRSGMQIITAILLLTWHSLVSADCLIKDVFTEPLCDQGSSSVHKELTDCNTCTHDTHNWYDSAFVQSYANTRKDFPDIARMWLLYCRFHDKMQNPCAWHCNQAASCYSCDPTCQGIQKDNN